MFKGLKPILYGGREVWPLVEGGKGVLYLSTTLRDVGKSRMSRILTKPVYQEMTIRSYGTCHKILTLMDRR